MDRNGGDNEDGGVSSKAVEGNVADFLRKEATSNYDFRYVICVFYLSMTVPSPCRVYKTYRILYICTYIVLHETT